jgi:uncharacterized membrane protein SirB2
MVFRKPERKMRLTQDEEFQLFKIIIDKYLWLGTIGLVVGIFVLFNSSISPWFGLTLTLIGGFILLAFTAIMSRHFDFKKKL